MWEVLVVYLLDGVAQKQERTHYPPLLGDQMLIGGADVVVVRRVWKPHNTEQRILDVILEKVKTVRGKKS